MNVLVSALAQAAQKGPGLWETLLLFAPILFIWYFLVIRPQTKQADEKAKLMESVKRGDQVVLTSGIFGRIEEVQEKAFVVEIAEKVKIRVTRESVQDVLKAPEAKPQS